MNDRRFGEPEGKFTLAVPAGYRHRSQIDTFTKRMRGRPETQYIDTGLTSENFTLVTNRLLASKLYEVSFLPVRAEYVSSVSCLAHLKSQHALLVSAQGLTLVQSLMPEEFPVESTVFSLDEKKKLFADEEKKYRTPFVRLFRTGLWDFGLGDWVDGLNEGERLLLVREAL